VKLFVANIKNIC